MQISAKADYAVRAMLELAAHGPELARMIGRTAWQGYRAEGPKLENMALVRGAYQSQYG